MPIQKQYRATINRIAIAMLAFVMLNLLQGLLLGVLSFFTDAMTPICGEIVYELVSAFLYAVCFCLPVWIFFKLPSPRAPRVADFRCELPANTLLYILFGVALVSAAAYVNAFVVGFFDYAEFSSEVLWEREITANYQLVLMFITLVVVPAFVEEFLFRGVILENLLPYGRTTAILVSAVLFGLMHQNIEQLFYATVAGVVIGWVYLRTRSIWSCVLLHFFNNFQSVLGSALGERLPEGRSTAALYLIEGAIFVLGILSGVWLLLQDKGKKELATEETAGGNWRLRGFFTVPMVLFCVISLAQMALLVWLSQTYLA